VYASIYLDSTLNAHQVQAVRHDRLAETARASLSNGLMWRPVSTATTPDPLLMAHGSPCAMVRTPDPPESRKLSAVLESQPSELTAFGYAVAAFLTSFLHW